MELKVRIKNMEPFKDGNILGGKFLKAGEVLVVSERDATLIQNSGGTIEVLERVIPNPLKALREAREEVLLPEDEPQKHVEGMSSYREVASATGELKPGQTIMKPKRGRPRKS